METLDTLVKAGKVRALGASAMYGYQFHNMQLTAEKNGLPPFSAMQNHYNLIYREDERELIPICRQYGVSLIPYSPLAGGHLTHRGWNTDSARSRTDRNLRNKYDASRERDECIVNRVAQIAAERGTSMGTVALTHFDDAVAAVDLKLTEKEIAQLEELYIPHAISGARPPIL